MQSDFLSQSIDLTGGALGLGAAAMGQGGITKFTFACWFRHPISNWPSSGFHALIHKDAAGQRAFLVQLIAEGVNGQLQIGFGDGINLTTMYVPNDTMTGRFWNFLGVSFDSGVVLVNANGHAVTLTQPGQPIPWPSAIGPSSSQLVIGGYGPIAPLSSMFGGPIGNIGLWSNFASTQAQFRAMWNDFRPVDYREMQVESAVPPPTHYVIGNGSTVEVMQGSPVVPAGNVLVSALKPEPRRTKNEMFTRRYLLNNVGEQSGGQYPAGVLAYSSNPSLLPIPGTQIVLMAYSRGTSHDDNHVGFIARSPDGGRTWPIGGRTHPVNAGAYEAAIPHGDLSGAVCPKRGFTLTRVPGIGAGGASRIFCAFVEAQIPGTPSRRVWLMYTDSDPAGALTWSAPIDVGGAGTGFNSIGKPNIVVRQTDGSLLLPYYRQMFGQGMYTSSVMRSTDAGLSWAHLSDIAHGAGLQYEEPHIGYLAGSSVLMGQARIDSSRDIVRATSLDHGATWGPLAKAYDGYSAPTWVEKSDRLVTLVRHDSADAAASYGDILVSRNKGVSWSPPVKFTDRSTDLLLYPDLALLPDGSIACAYAQEYTSGGAFLEFAVLDEKYLEKLP